MINRQGVGKIRHLATRVLWLQEKVRRKEVRVESVPTTSNHADIGTKAHTQQRIKYLAGLIGIVNGETWQKISDGYGMKGDELETTEVGQIMTTILEAMLKKSGRRR